VFVIFEFHEQIVKEGAILVSNEFLGVATDDNFEGEVLKSAKPVLIDFWAPWCGPCKAIGPIVEELASQLKDSVKIMKLNVDENQKTALNFGVRSIPTLILFKEGKVLDTLIGLVPKEKLEEFVKKSL
jgi:thioredoxin 1